MRAPSACVLRFLVSIEGLTRIASAWSARLRARSNARRRNRRSPPRSCSATCCSSSQRASASAASASCSTTAVHRASTHASSPSGALQPRPGGQHDATKLAYPAAASRKHAQPRGRIPGARADRAHRRIETGESTGRRVEVASRVAVQAGCCRFDRPMKVKSVLVGVCGAAVLLGLARVAVAA
jgi:hypothetical protein